MHSLAKKPLTQRQIRLRRDRVFNLLFAAPGTFIYTMIMVLPIFFTIYYSLHKWSGVGAMKFIGLDNYIKLFSSRDYAAITQNTLTLVACSFFITVPMSLMLSYLIYRTKRGFKFFRTVVFMPVILSAVVVGLIFSILLNADMGPVNQLLRGIGLGSLAKPWLSNKDTVLGAVILPQIWSNIGYFTIIFLAGMQSVPEDIIESATIDGANSFHIFTRIIIPLVADISQIVIILVVTYALKSFGFSWSMTQGGPGVRSSFFTVYMYIKAFVDSNFGLSSAVSLNVLSYAMAFTLLFKWLVRRIRAFS